MTGTTSQANQLESPLRSITARKQQGQAKRSAVGDVRTCLQPREACDRAGDRHKGQLSSISRPPTTGHAPQAVPVPAGSVAKHGHALPAGLELQEPATAPRRALVAAFDHAKGPHGRQKTLISECCNRPSSVDAP